MCLLLLAPGKLERRHERDHSILRIAFFGDLSQAMVVAGANREGLAGEVEREATSNDDAVVDALEFGASLRSLATIRAEVDSLPLCFDFAGNLECECGAAV